MSKAIADPEEMRRFAADLKRFNTELRNQITVLQGRFVNLSQTWRDQEHSKFADAYEQTMKVLLKFIDASEQHIPFLLRKAERIEEYLQQR